MQVLLEYTGVMPEWTAGEPRSKRPLWYEAGFDSLQRDGLERDFRDPRWAPDM